MLVAVIFPCCISRGFGFGCYNHCHHQSEQWGQRGEGGERDDSKFGFVSPKLNFYALFW